LQKNLTAAPDHMWKKIIFEVFLIWNGLATPRCLRAGGPGKRGA
jgi:hypothetical protein